LAGFHPPDLILLSIIFVFSHLSTMLKAITADAGRAPRSLPFYCVEFAQIPGCLEWQ
jgi:hypothetical protein